MFKVSIRYRHFIYGVIQSGLTCSIAAAIASFPYLGQSLFMQHWLRSLGISWLTMLPVVVAAAPVIRRLAEWITE
jgi:hypothetical protein